MTNTAEVYNLQEIKERGGIVKADTDDGFIMLATTLNRHLGKFGLYRLNGRERCFIDCVIEKTFGYKKKMDWISEQQFAEFMELDGTSNISKIKKGLLNKKILIEDGKKIGVNPIVSEWETVKNNSSDKSNSTAKQSKTTGDKNSQKRLVEQSKTTGGQSKTTAIAVKNDPHKRINYTKDNNTKDKGAIENIDLPGCLPRENWLEFIYHRKTIKKPLSELAATKFLKKVGRFHGKGYDVIECIDQAITSGWSDIYEPKNFGPIKRQLQPENFEQRDYGESSVAFMESGNE